MDEALRASEARFATMFQASPEAITLTSLATGRVLDVNPAFERVSGWSRSESLGRTVLELGIWADPAVRDELVHRLVEAGRVSNFEFTFRTRSGRLIAGEVSAVIVEIDGETCFLAFTRDITERRMAEAARAQAERSLRESEERYRAAFEQAAVGIAEVALDGRFLRVNDALCGILGYSREELLHRTVIDLTHPDDREADRARLERVVRGREPQLRAIKRYLHRSGRVVYGALSASLVHDAEGHPQYFVSVIQDLSERLAAEAEARRQKAFLDELFDSVPEAIVLLDGADRVLRVNREFTRLFGYPSADAVGQRVNDLILPADRLEEGAALTRRAMGGELLDLEAVRRRRDGTLRRVQLLTLPVRLPGEEQTTYAIYRDITERKAAEEALQRSEERFATAFRSSPDSITITSLADGRMVDANAGFCRITGYTRAEVLGRTTIDLNIWPRPEDRELLVDLLRRDGMAREVELQFRIKSGESITCMVSAELVELGGEPCMLAVTRDITERRALEEQVRRSQRMEAIGRLAGGVAHDFNNLLTAILAHAEFAKNAMTADDPRLADIDGVLLAANRAGELTRRLLTFARRQVAEPRLVAVNELVLTLERILRRLLGPGVEFVTRLEPALWWVRVDPSHFEQVLVNLVVNARDAMPEGGRLTLRTLNVPLQAAAARIRPDLAAGDYVLVEVADTGSGIDAEIMEQIFEPFFTTKPMGQGTGLGLATCYGIVRQAGGAIEVASPPGAGATFRVYLPRAEELPTAGGPAAGELLNPPAGHESVLLVEDEPQVRHMVERTLLALGYRVRGAASAEEALALDLGELDLLITDLMLPGLRGVELARQLQAARPGLRLLLVSGYAADGAPPVGPDAPPFLAKPFTPAQLARRVRAVLDGPAPAADDVASEPAGG